MISTSCEDVQRRALGTDHTRQVTDINASKLETCEDLLVGGLHLVRRIAAVDLACVALLRGGPPGARRGRREDEKGGSSDEGERTSEHGRVSWRERKM